MNKFFCLLILVMMVSCKKGISQEEALYYKEIDAPIDTTVIDSVVGKASFDAINARIENAKKDSIKKTKKDSAKSTEQKIAEAKKKLLEAQKKSEKDKKVEKNSTKEESDKEKQQQEKKIEELSQTPEN